MSTERTRHRIAVGASLTLLVAQLLACMPYLSDSHPEVAYQPVAWQCPTPSPIPTVIVGYDEEHGGGPPPTPTTVERHPIYSTPVPTATPYIRTGSDYYQGQRVKVGPIVVAVVGTHVRPGTDADHAIHLVDITVENAAPQPVEAHFELSFLRTIRRPDNRVIEGTWYPSADAATTVGIAPLPAQWSPGTTAATLAIRAPDGRPEAWGMPFVRGNTTRTGQTGDGYVWIRFRRDPYCGQRGGPPSDAYNPAAPPGAPAAGRGGWPVPPDTAISRGYGCSSFYTGVHGDCPAGMWWHDGVDFASSPGTPLFAVRPFDILYTGPDNSPMDCAWISGSEPPHKGFGLYVKARDPSSYVYWYGHASGFTTSAGAQVAAGQQIARMGSTGCSTGSHLHFRVRIDGLDRNPFDVIEER